MEAPVKFELVDINEILKTLPHRYPMLLIDRVIKIRHSLVIFRIVRSIRE